jgi:hypothetical protein
MNMISNSDLSSAESNLNINNIYNLVNDNSSITNFGENNVFNSEAISLSSESRGRGRKRNCSLGHSWTRMLKKINKPKPIWTQTLYTLIIHIWMEFKDLMRLRIRNIVEITSHS